MKVVALSLLLLLILLTGCQVAPPEIQVRTEYVVLKPGVSYLTPQVLPTEPTTYKDYIVYKYQCSALVQSCNNDKEGIANEYERTIQLQSTSE